MTTFAEWKAQQWPAGSNGAAPAWLNTDFAKELYQKQMASEARDWTASLQAKQIEDLREEIRQLRSESREDRKRIQKVERAVEPENGYLVQAIIKALRELKTDVMAQQIKFAGVYEVGQRYRANSLVIRSGSLWISHRDTAGLPGAHEDWQMCTKGGQPQKDPTLR